MMPLPDLRSLEVNIEGTVGESIADELGHALDLDETILVHVEVLESTLDINIAGELGVAHTGVSLDDLGENGLGVSEVAEHMTGLLAVKDDLTGVATDKGVHETVISLKSESGGHVSGVTITGRGAAEISGHLIVALNEGGIVLRIGLLVHLDKVVKDGKSLMVVDVLGSSKTEDSKNRNSSHVYSLKIIK